MYDDLENDSRVDPGAVEALSKENPTLANVLIDYFELHKFGKINIYMHPCLLLMLVYAYRQTSCNTS